MSAIAVRVRTQVGSYRLNDVNPTDTFGTLRERMKKEHNAELTSLFSLDQKKTTVPDTTTVGEANLVNGHMLYADISAATRHDNPTTTTAAAASGNLIVKADGTIGVAEAASWISSMLGSTLTTKSGDKSSSIALSGKKRVGLYFSASWVSYCF
jgi:hypothetical protein